MHVGTTPHLNYSRQESKQASKNTQFALDISDTPVTLKQSQGNKTYNENVYPEQVNKHAKSERSRFNSVREKGIVKVFVKRRNVSIVSLE